MVVLEKRCLATAGVREVGGFVLLRVADSASETCVEVAYWRAATLHLGGEGRGKEEVMVGLS